MKNEEYKTKTFKLSHDQLEAAIVNYLASYNFLHDMDVLSVDLGVPVDDNGYVEMELTYLEQ